MNATIERIVCLPRDRSVAITRSTWRQMTDTANRRGYQRVFITNRSVRPVRNAPGVYLFLLRVFR